MMLDAVKKHNPNVQSHLFPHATHTYWSFEDRVVRLNEVSAFLSQYLVKAASGNASVQAPTNGASH
jgi:dipeptidyl aminopeptidase/acylaminoacyl peptidase